MCCFIVFPLSFSCTNWNKVARRKRDLQIQMKEWSKRLWISVWPVASAGQTLGAEIFTPWCECCVCAPLLVVVLGTQQERPMYYSDAPSAVVVRQCGATLKVKGQAMLFLPVLSALSSCAACPVKSSSAGVSDLFPGLHGGGGGRGGRSLSLSLPPTATSDSVIQNLSKDFILIFPCLHLDQWPQLNQSKVLDSLNHMILLNVRCWRSCDLSASSRAACVKKLFRLVLHSVTFNSSWI